jgi:hypothetical protein
MDTDALIIYEREIIYILKWVVVVRQDRFTADCGGVEEWMPTRLFCNHGL